MILDWRRWGGAGDDTFIFASGHGDDAIADFTDSEDLIDLTVGLTGFSDLAVSIDPKGVMIGLSAHGRGTILLERLDPAAIWTPRISCSHEAGSRQGDRTSPETQATYRIDRKAGRQVGSRLGTSSDSRSRWRLATAWSRMSRRHYTVVEAEREIHPRNERYSTSAERPARSWPVTAIGQSTVRRDASSLDPGSLDGRRLPSPSCIFDNTSATLKGCRRSRDFTFGGSR